MLGRTIQELYQMRLFKHMPFKRLVLQLAVNKLLSYPSLVARSKQFYGVSCRMLSRKFTHRLLAATVGNVFTCSNDETSIQNEVARLKQNNIGAILDYCAEALTIDDSKTTLDRNAHFFHYSLQISQRLVGRPFFSIKVSALLQLKLLQKITDIRTRMKAIHLGPPQPAAALVDRFCQNFNATEEEKEVFIRNILSVEPDTLVDRIHWILNVRPYYVARPQHNTNPLIQRYACLSDLEMSNLQCFKDRVDMIFKDIDQKPARILVDAEQIRLNEAIYCLLMDYQEQFNKETHSIFTTIQSYLKNSNELLQDELQMKKRLGLKPALKIVRGAYMLQERQIAKRDGLESPIHESYDNTSKSYDQNTAKSILENDSMVVIASHNKESIQKIIKADKGTNSKLAFAQLKGIGDALSYQLAANNKQVYKCIPYGEIDIMIPFLIRRAQQVSQNKYPVREKISLIKAEIRSRFFL